MAQGEKLSRRSFVKQLSALAESKKSGTAFHLHTPGRTGMKYTPLGFGSMRTFDPSVIRKAIDMGINKDEK